MGPWILIAVMVAIFGGAIWVAYQGWDIDGAVETPASLDFALVLMVVLTLTSTAAAKDMMSCRNARKTNRNPEQRDHGGPLTFSSMCHDQPAQVDERVGQKPARGVSREKRRSIPLNLFRAGQ